PLAAQAEVKISGGLQAEIVSLSGDNVTEGLYMMDGQEGGNQNSGNWGFLKFSASEDLGNGMKALAMYNFNVRADDGSNGPRDAYVGLSGNFGTILAGKMSSPYKASTVSWDPFLTTSAQARGNYGMSTLHNGYVSNTVAYANKFGMAKVKAAIILDEAADDADSTETSGDHAFSVSVNVPVGPIELALAHHAADDFGTDVGNPLVVGDETETGDFSASKVGAKYAAGAMSVAAQMEMMDYDGDDVDHAYINGTFTAGANTFAVAYGQQDEDATDLTKTYMSVGVVHAFSKTTTAHLGYIGLDHDDGTDDAGIAAGLRVKF
ncbi:MAG: porin, partial [Gammaproteobacteria bacterium]|nr:porin [Gammaproteobacteria bacterium]